MTSNVNPFAARLEQQKQGQVPPQELKPQQAQVNPFAARVKEKESFAHELGEGFAEEFEALADVVKKIPGIRTLLQAPIGYANATPYGIVTNLMQMIGTGEALSEDSIDELDRAHQRLGIPFDREGYIQGVQNVSAKFPTPSNLARMAGEEIGVETEPQNFVERALRVAGGGAGFSKGGAVPKAVGGGTSAVAYGALEAGGVPEPISELVALGVGPVGASGVGELKLPKIETKKAPSGLTKLGFENIKEKTEISPKKLEKINTKVEKEFKDLSEKIFETSPIKDIREALKEGPAFKESASEAFLEVEAIADQLPNKIPTKNVKKQLVDNVIKEKGTGFLPSEKEATHKRFIKQFLEDTPEGEITAADLVTQYRKNNAALKEVYEPGQSFAHNQAKRQALTDYNRAIADVIESEFPNSEFSKLFKESNAQWAKIMDAEAINTFTDQLFDGKIQFKKGSEFFDKAGMTKSFERALGKEGFKDYKQLMNDLMSKEKTMGLLKAAQDKGFFQKATETGLAFWFNPWVGKGKVALDVGKGIWKSATQMMLDKPQLIVKWDKGIQALKKGDFAKAETIMKELQSEKKVFDLRNEFMEILPKEGQATAKQAAQQAFDKNGLTGFMQEAMDAGFANTPQELEAYLMNPKNGLSGRVDNVEKETGKTLKELLKDFEGNEKASETIDTSVTTIPKSIESKKS